VLLKLMIIKNIQLTYVELLSSKGLKPCTSPGIIFPPT